MQIEKWLDIRGYEGLYEVSNTGKVRNVRTGRILSQSLQWGYYVVCLSKNGKTSTLRVHRLVLCTFTNKELTYNMQAGHINECRTDNMLENLEWTNATDNNRMPLRRLRISQANKKRVIDTRTQEVYSAVYEAIQKLEVNTTIFYKMINEGVIAYV